MLIITISTLFSRLVNIKVGQFPVDERIRYVISCQGDKLYDDAYYNTCLINLFGEHVIWGEEIKPGLSNNRNNALKLACDNFSNLGAYIYVCDDDININIDGLLNAVNIMHSNKLASLTGIITTKDGFFKNYAAHTYKHNKLSAAKICSVEILIELDFLFKNQILFDTRFGLGSQYPSGEEFIFINDILAAGGRVDYYPIQICTHPPLSSGDDFYSDDRKIMAKGAMLKRVFKYPSYYILIFIFAIKKYKEYKNKISILQFLYKMLQGSWEIKK